MSLGQIGLPLSVDVMGLPLRPLTAEGLVALLIERAQARLSTTVYYANAHTANLARRDARFRRTLCGGDILYADGASIVWASRWSTRRLPRRMTAADFFPRFARRCAETGVTLYLLGGRPGIAEQAAANLRAELPNLRIVGTHHGYFADEESARVVAEINAARPDALLVGLSSPRQEFWLAEHAGRPREARAAAPVAQPREARAATPVAQPPSAVALDVPVKWCIGALLDYFAGVERRAPAWLCNIGGEWLFRLLVDPVGKWRRYLVGNPVFVWNALRWRLFERGRARARAATAWRGREAGGITEPGRHGAVP
jgi:N-acetylglucosaminyldiphosphoundecaprenol N-acetyl-beta-D-mannosaminyltransferase